MAETTETPAPPWIPSDTDFASRLALVRHRMGWNVKEAARECGVAAATWRLWEVDGALPRNIITIGMAIAQRTGCDYLWLVHGPNRGGAGPNGRWVATRILHQVPSPVPAGVTHLGRAVTQTRPIVDSFPRPLVPAAP